MISCLVIGRVRIFRSQRCLSSIVLGVKDFWVSEFRLIKMEAKDIDNDITALGEQLAIKPNI